MAEQTQWEYRVLTIGGMFGTKDEQIQAALNEWGDEGWEAIMVYTPEGSGKVTMVAKASNAASAVARKPGSNRISARPTLSIVGSRFEIDHFAHRHYADGHPHDTAQKHQLPACVGEHDHNVLRSHD